MTGRPSLFVGIVVGALVAFGLFETALGAWDGSHFPVYAWIGVAGIASGIAYVAARPSRRVVLGTALLVVGLPAFVVGWTYAELVVKASYVPDPEGMSRTFSQASCTGPFGMCASYVLGYTAPAGTNASSAFEAFAAALEAKGWTVADPARDVVPWSYTAARFLAAERGRATMDCALGPGSKVPAQADVHCLVR